jgi:hypothetical protein
MSKPSWKMAPKWANYLVQEMDGTWVWFAKEPERKDTYWAAIGMHEIAKRPESKNWKDSMERRP